jgi:hypothetical protein
MSSLGLREAVERGMRQSGGSNMRDGSFASLVGDPEFKARVYKWASCSSNGNRNFNAELLELNREIGEYVIVHELLQLCDDPTASSPNWFIGE